MTPQFKPVKKAPKLNTKRQPGSLKLWEEPNGYVHETVIVHKGRVSKQVVGPQGKVFDVAHEFMKSALKEGRL